MNHLKIKEKEEEKRQRGCGEKKKWRHLYTHIHGIFFFIYVLYIWFSLLYKIRNCPLKWFNILPVKINYVQSYYKLFICGAFYPLNHKRVGVEDLKLNVSNYTRTKKTTWKTLIHTINSWFSNVLYGACWFSYRLKDYNHHSSLQCLIGTMTTERSDQ